MAGIPGPWRAGAANDPYVDAAVMAGIPGPWRARALQGGTQADWREGAGEREAVAAATGP